MTITVYGTKYFTYLVLILFVQNNLMDAVNLTFPNREHVYELNDALIKNLKENYFWTIRIRKRPCDFAPPINFIYEKQPVLSLMALSGRGGGYLYSWVSSKTSKYYLLYRTELQMDSTHAIFHHKRDDIFGSRFYLCKKTGIHVFNYVNTRVPRIENTFAIIHSADDGALLIYITADSKHAWAQVRFDQMERLISQNLDPRQYYKVEMDTALNQKFGLKGKDYDVENLRFTNFFDPAISVSYTLKHNFTTCDCENCCN